MKKFYFLMVIIIFAHVQIASAGGRRDRNDSADSPVSLEIAIERAAEHIARDLRPGTRIAIVEFESEHDNLSHHIMEELTGELLRQRIEIADRQNLPWIFQEFKFQMSGAVSDETAQSLGQLIGAELIVVGRLLDIVDMYRNQVDAVHVERATRESAARNNVTKDRETQRMIEAIVNQTTTVRVYRYGVTEQTNPETAGVFLDRGIMFLRHDEHEKAIADFDEAIRLNPNLAGAYLMRGVSVHYLYGDFERAMEDYNQAIRLNPNMANPYLIRGNMYLSIRNFDQAIADYSQFIRLQPELASLGYSFRGNAYYNKGDYDSAIADYTQAIRLYPDGAGSYSSRGHAYFNKGDYDRAIADYTSAIRLHPDNVQNYNSRAATYFRKEDYDRAIADYTRVIQIDPNFTLAYINRGSAYLVRSGIINSRRDIDRAIADFEAALHLEPNNTDVNQVLEYA